VISMLPLKAGASLLLFLFIFSASLIFWELMGVFNLPLFFVEIWILIEIALLIDYLISQ